MSNPAKPLDFAGRTLYIGDKVACVTKMAYLRKGTVIAVDYDNLNVYWTVEVETESPVKKIKRRIKFFSPFDKNIVKV